MMTLQLIWRFCFAIVVVGVIPPLRRPSFVSELNKQQRVGFD
jgi:hypothetical protein